MKVISAYFAVFLLLAVDAKPKMNFKEMIMAQHKQVKKAYDTCEGFQGELYGSSIGEEYMGTWYLMAHGPIDLETDDVYYCFSIDQTMIGDGHMIQSLGHGFIEVDDDQRFPVATATWVHDGHIYMEGPDPMGVLGAATAYVVAKKENEYLIKFFCKQGFVPEENFSRVYLYTHSPTPNPSLLDEMFQIVADNLGPAYAKDQLYTKPCQH